MPGTVKPDYYEMIKSDRVLRQSDVQAGQWLNESNIKLLLF